MAHLIKSDASPPSSLSREPRPTATLTNHITHNLFNGGALDSQVSDSQHIRNLTEQHTVDHLGGDNNSDVDEVSFASSGSSDTAYDMVEMYYAWQSASSQGDEWPKPPVGAIVDDPMDESNDYPFSDSRPTTPDFIAQYADLKADNIRLSNTEVRVIAAIRADKDSQLRQYATHEGIWYADMSKTHNQCARIAALESLLKHHGIPIPEFPLPTE